MMNHLQDLSQQKDDSTSSVVTTGEEDRDLRPFMTNREKLRNLMHSHKFQVSIIALVILDSLLVIAELMLDLKMLELHEEHHLAPHVLHYMSIGILSIFIIEITVKVYAFGLSFFHHKLEVFDAFVVFLSFSLDVAYRNDESITSGLGLVIVMRLWRVARILNGIVMSVKTQSEHKLLKERKLRDNVEQDLLQCKNYSDALESEIYHLHQILNQKGIEAPTTIVDLDALCNNTTRVVAEINASPQGE